MSSTKVGSPTKKKVKKMSNTANTATSQVIDAAKSLPNIEAAKTLAEAVAAAGFDFSELTQAPANVPGSNITPIVPKTPTKPLPGLVERPDAPEQPDQLLLKILRTKRCHGSQGDSNFRIWLGDTIKNFGGVPVNMAEGCITVTTDDKSKTLFSCHIDTCHSSVESDGTFQDLAYDPVMGHLFLGGVKKAGCLGADDGVGVFIMLKMLEAKVPGTYIFHTGEERGGIGSRAMLRDSRVWLAKFDRAIAFDRPGDFEVIVTQGGQSCASITAGEFIMAELQKHGMIYEISHKGSFTDTKVYAEVIPECFNLGVAYYEQHGPSEYLDVVHAEALCKAALTVNWGGIPVVRKAVVPAYVNKPYKNKGGYDYGASSFKPQPTTPAAPVKKAAAMYSAKAIIEDELITYVHADFLELVDTEPSIAANVLVLLYAKYRAALEENAVYSALLELD